MSFLVHIFKINKMKYCTDFLHFVIFLCIVIVSYFSSDILLRILCVNHETSTLDKRQTLFKRSDSETELK